LTTVVVISGDRRVDTGKLGGVVGGPLRAGTPEEVGGTTGYSIGGVPPFPHRNGVRVLLDRSIMEHAQVWAAAGASNAVFRIRSVDLARLVGGVVNDFST
jgi:prolyl-tRNA editing enzyme YbaK/EbsC (Cys-tRNA(Pro) deacylase)